MVLLTVMRRLIQSKPLFPMMIPSLPLRCLCTQTVGYKLDETKMDEAVKQLERITINFKHFSPSAGLFTPDIELEDEIMKKTIKGLADYQLHAVKYMFYINWKYNAFKIQPIEVTKNHEQGIVDIKWQLFGKTGWILVFLVDLGKSISKNHEERRDDWEAMEGTSTFYINEDGKIYKQILKRTKVGTYRDLIRLPGEKKVELKG